MMTLEDYKNESPAMKAARQNWLWSSYRPPPRRVPALPKWTMWQITRVIFWRVVVPVGVIVVLWYAVGFILMMLMFGSVGQLYWHLRPTCNRRDSRWFC